MNKRYYINDRQLKLITEHVKQQELLEEGWKEVVLGAALLLGSTFGGNEVKAQQAKDTINKSEVLNQIKTTLEDEEGINKLANYLRMEPEQLSSYMQKNADKIEQKFDEVAKDKNLQLTLNLDDIKNQKTQISSKIKQGYGVSSIKLYKDSILKQGDEIIIEKQMSLDYTNMDMFLSGGVKLSPQVRSDIENMLSMLESINGKVSGVIIEASTDKEPISIGNEQLAQNRANSVIQILNSMGIDNIKTNILPNQGPDLFKKGMTSQERSGARQTTSQYRYVKITFIVDFQEPIKPTQQTVYEILEKVEVKLVKVGVNELTGGSKKIKGGKPKTKCKSIKKKGSNKPTECYFFDL